MSNPLRVSVLVPVYNAEAYLRTALDSISSQKGVEFEVLIGDNASTDASARIAADYEGSHIHLIRNKKNVGMYQNLRQLARQAKAPLVKILCADDALLPGGLEAQVRFMEAHPRVGISRCLSEGDLSAKLSVNHFYERQLPSCLLPKAVPLAFATFGNLPGSLTNVIVRRDAFDEAGDFDPSLPYAADFDMWYRIARRHGIGLQAEESVFVRSHPEQNSNLLNRRNELAVQQRIVHDRIFADIRPEDRRLLRWHNTVHIVSQQLPRSFRCWTRGERDALRCIFEPRSYSYSGFRAILVCFATGFRRWGANWSTRVLSRRIHALQTSC